MHLDTQLFPASPCLSMPLSVFMVYRLFLLLRWQILTHPLAHSSTSLASLARIQGLLFPFCAHLPLHSNNFLVCSLWLPPTPRIVHPQKQGPRLSILMSLELGSEFGTGMKHSECLLSELWMTG